MSESWNSVLSHSSHIANIINVGLANQRSNFISRKFVTRDIATLKPVFVRYVRPLLEYNTVSVIWSPQYISDIHALKRSEDFLPNAYPPNSSDIKCVLK